jgi:hypothetical protein
VADNSTVERSAQIITRQEAIARGFKRFFTDIPCKNNHVPARRVYNRQCIQCARQNEAARRAANPGLRSWTGMVQRCENPRHHKFKYYGGHSVPVKIHPRYRYGEDGLNGYQCLLADIGPKPGPGYFIDRVNPDGNYEPGNLRWATSSEQRPRRKHAMVIKQRLERPKPAKAIK